MKKILIITIIVFLTVNLFADERDSLLYAVNKKTGDEIVLKNTKNYYLKLKDGEKIEGRYYIIDDSLIQFQYNKTVNINNVDVVKNSEKELSKLMFLNSIGLLLLSAVIAGITLFIRYWVIKAQNQGAPPNSGEWGLPFAFMFFITIIGSIGVFFMGIYYSIFAKKYSSKKYNFKIK
jgi:hypothetical protein